MRLKSDNIYDVHKICLIHGFIFAKCLVRGESGKHIETHMRMVLITSKTSVVQVLPWTQRRERKIYSLLLFIIKVKILIDFLAKVYF